MPLHAREQSVVAEELVVAPGFGDAVGEPDQAVSRPEHQPRVAEAWRRQYAEQRMRLTRQTLRAVVSRAHSLRREYENRYSELRDRLLKLSTLVLCAAVLWTACLTVWAYPCLGE